MILPCLHIEKHDGKGRGIFTEEFIPENTVIEIAPVIVMQKADREYLDLTLLHDYIFEWRLQKNECCMALGMIPIYNHSYKSNCEYFMDYDEETIMVKTVTDILPGEEVTINYSGDWDNAGKVWFEVK